MNDRALSVAMVTPWYGREDNGGVAIAVENLVHGLQTVGVRTSIIRIVGDGWFPVRKKGRWGETVIYLPVRPRSKTSSLKPFLGYWLRLPLAWVVMSFLLVKSRCQIVNFHYYAEHYGDLQKIVLAFGKRMITTFHGSDIVVGTEDDSSLTGIRKLVEASSCVVIVSNALLKQLTLKLPDSVSKYSVIPNSIDMSFLSSTQGYINPTDTDIDVLFVGGLQLVKGPDLLLEAFTQLLKQKNDARLCIIGTGAMQEELAETIRERHLESNVELLGMVPHHGLVHYYKRAKLVAIPSRSEGLPLVAIEAAIAGKPVVAFDVGGLSEVISHESSGLVVSANNTSELSNAMLKLLEVPELCAQLGSQARARALKLYDPSTMAERYKNLYGDVLAAS